MLNWIFPVIVVKVEHITVEDETNGDAKESRGTKVAPPTTITKLSVTPDFVKKHMNYIYVFKEDGCTPIPQYRFVLAEGPEGDVVVVQDIILGTTVGNLQDDGTIEVENSDGTA